MKREKKKYYDVDMFGIYNPAYALYRDSGDGKVITAFRDAAYWNTDKGMEQKREMLIDGKVYKITSVFPDEEKSTPTAKMLSLIDSEVGENAGKKY